ncbi:MAG: DUF1554 domain-containing protein [Spirochaetia bacterium]|nr:DUF1554 domain-containing protein [Spirochaetia bacterium]
MAAATKICRLLVLFPLVACTRFPINQGEADSALAAIALANLEISRSDVGATAPLPPLGIFITSASLNPGTQFNSVFRADAACMEDAAYPGGTNYAGNFEALLASPVHRNPTLSGSWVLHPERKYIRTGDQVEIQTADSSGRLTFPLKAAVDPGNVAGVWTGFAADWSIANHCASWSSTAGNGQDGSTNGITNATLAVSDTPCSGSRKLICVEQPLAPERPALRIFVTSLPQRPGIDFSSIATADARCMADANYPGTGTFKAMITGSGVRRASNLPSQGDAQLDWVLQPSRRYVRAADGLEIQTTNRRALFPFPLRNAFSTIGANFWGGLTGYWTSGNDCSGWTSSSGAAFGGAGFSSLRDRFSIATGSNPCSNTTTRLLCVEQ